MACVKYKIHPAKEFLPIWSIMVEEETCCLEGRGSYHGGVIAMTTTILGNGIYSFGEAARLVGVSQQRLRAWFCGWPNRVSPIAQSDYDLAGVISFWDLVDAMVIGQLRSHKFSLPYLRKVTQALRDEFGTPHPFCVKGLLYNAHSHRVFVQSADELGDERIKEIVKGEWVLGPILKPFLKQLEHDPASKLAQQWRIAEGVVIDPRRQYGKPIVDAVGVPTSVLWASFIANNRDANLVANWYGILPEHVQFAVRFQDQFFRKAA
jgi:uncharacterized protein (DUF433 family)